MASGTNVGETENKVTLFFRNCWKYLTPLIVGIVVGLLINLPKCSGTPESKIEYIPVHDTIKIYKDSIVYKTKPVNIYHIDTFYVKESGDTIKLDSIPITEYQYKDTVKTDSTSTEIMVNFHGFNAGIDSINLVHNYFNTKETIVIPPKKIGLTWTVGVGVGFGGHMNINSGTFGYGPEVGIYGVVGLGGIIK